jgi:hypothetical protein
MTQRKHILLGFLIGYLTLCLGVATGVTLPGDHSIRGFEPSLAFSAFGGSIEARYVCQAKRVEVIGHDTTGSFRAVGRGTLVFEQPGTALFTTPWTWDRNSPSPDQVIAMVSTAQTVGRWTVHLQEDPTVLTAFQVDAGPCPPSPTPGQTVPAPTQRSPGPTQPATPTPSGTPTPSNPAQAPNRSAPACGAQYVYDSKTRRCVPLGSTGLG